MNSSRVSQFPLSLTLLRAFNCMAVIISTLFSDYGHTLGGRGGDKNIKHPFNKTVYNTCVLTKRYRQGCFFRGCQRCLQRKSRTVPTHGPKEYICFELEWGRANFPERGQQVQGFPDKNSGETPLHTIIASVIVR